MRQAAYDEMKKQFTSSGSETDGCFRPFLDNPGIFKKIVTDANVVAQENGVGALCAFLEFGGSNACLRTRSTVVSPLIEKGLGSSRAGTKRNAIDAILWYIELDTPDPVIEELIPFLSHRTPKLVVASTNSITEIIRAFGAKTVHVKPIIPLIPKLFAHADKNVRAEANQLVIELYKWLGDSFSQLVLPDLKPVQQKELEEAFGKVKGETPHQQRYLKSQREAMERQQLNGISDSNEGSGGGGGGGDGAQEDEDEEMPDLVDPVAVLNKVPDDFEQRVTSTKWKDRKEVLEEVRDAFNVSKMVNEEFGDMIRILAKCMKDANIMVVMVAANIVEQLANGLKGGFAKYQPMIVPPMLERTKEKKVNVTEALGNALDAVFKSTGMIIGDVLDPILEHLKHKTPQVKIETAKFLIRCLKTTKSAPKDPEMKSIAESGIKLLSDTQEPVRAGGQEILGVLMKIFGERPLNPYLENVDDIKKTKVKEYCESAEVKAKPEKPKPAPQSKQSSAAAGGGGRKIAAPKKQSAAPSTAAAPSSANLKTPGSKPSAINTSTAAGKKRLAQSPLKPAASRDRTEKFADESAQQQQHQQQPPPQSPVSSTPQRNGNRGLASRPLTSASQARAQPPQPDPRVGVLEKEVEQLKVEKDQLLQEKEQFQRKSQEEQAEKARLMQEINDLQLKNAQLVEDHTRDILAIKSKETQLVRAQSDADTARHRITKLEQELERVPKDDNSSVGSGDQQQQQFITGQSALSSAFSRSRTGSGSPSSPLYESSNTAGAAGTPGSVSRSSRSRYGPNSIRRSIDFGNLNYKSSRNSSLEEKENSFKPARSLQESATSRSSSSSNNNEPTLQPPLEAENNGHDHGHEHEHDHDDDHNNHDGDGDTPMKDATSVASSSQHSKSKSNSNSNTAPVAAPKFQSQIPAPTAIPGENWKRAAEVTNQLRARIEAMKARQNRAR